MFLQYSIVFVVGLILNKCLLIAVNSSFSLFIFWENLNFIKYSLLFINNLFVQRDLGYFGLFGFSVPYFCFTLVEKVKRNFFPPCVLAQTPSSFTNINGFINGKSNHFIEQHTIKIRNELPTPKIAGTYFGTLCNYLK